MCVCTAQTTVALTCVSEQTCVKKPWDDPAQFIASRDTSPQVSTMSSACRNVSCIDLCLWWDPEKRDNEPSNHFICLQGLLLTYRRRKVSQNKQLFPRARCEMPLLYWGHSWQLERSCLILSGRLISVAIPGFIKVIRQGWLGVKSGYCTDVLRWDWQNHKMWTDFK